MQNELLTILSLREPYFQQMLDGKKRFEYRKVYKKIPTVAVVYISQTSQSIAGVIRFGAPIIDTPVAIAKLAVEHQEGSYEDMMAYFGERKQVYAMPIENIYLFETPVKRNDIRNKGIVFTPPQSYAHLDVTSDLYTYLAMMKLKQHM